MNRREKAYIRFRRRYDKNTLSRLHLEMLPFDKQAEYLLRNLRIKYKSETLKYGCYQCAITALYDDHGTVTDEELQHYKYYKKSHL